MKNINDVISGVDDVINNAKLGNFDDILAKTKLYAERATKKSAERLEISKKKIELLDSKAKLAKAYEKFGKLAYQKNEGAEVDEEAWNSSLAEIQLQKTRAELLDKEIEELRIIFTEPLSDNENEEKAQETEASE